MNNNLFNIFILGSFIFACLNSLYIDIISSLFSPAFCDTPSKLNLADQFEINNLDILDPLDQFEINYLLIITILENLINITFTNMVLYLIIGSFITIFLNVLVNKYKNSIFNYWTSGMETLYDTINSIVKGQINFTKGQIYFPFVYTLFVYILIENLIGMIPYSFATTSHFVLTFGLSFTIVLGSTLLGFQKHGNKLFSLFVPSGCPLALLPLLVIIEFISYLARNVSLGLRLAANILSGHMLLNILSGFSFKITQKGMLYLFLGIFPLLFIIAFSGLELGIAFIQAQVFVVLSCSYIKDGLDLH